MKTVTQLVTLITALAALNAQAVLYNINRSFTDTSNPSQTASLIGTVDVPLGSYTIQNQGPAPFTDVDLLLTVNGTPFALSYALTGIISGSGTFYINATPTQLIFATANANGTNPADLVFSSNPTNPSLDPRYAIGWNGAPGFESAFSGSAQVVTSLALPTVFGTAPIPEPATYLAGALLVLPFGVQALRRCRK